MEFKENNFLLKINKNLIRYLASFFDNRTLLRMTKFSKALQKIMNINNSFFKAFFDLDSKFSKFYKFDWILANYDSIIDNLEEEVNSKRFLFYLDYSSFQNYFSTISVDKVLLNNNLLVDYFEKSQFNFKIEFQRLEEMDNLRTGFINKISILEIYDAELFSHDYSIILNKLSQINDLTFSINLQGTEQKMCEKNIQFLNGKEMRKIDFKLMNYDMRFFTTLFNIDIRAECLSFSFQNHIFSWESLNDLLPILIKENKYIKRFNLCNSNSNYVNLGDLVKCSFFAFSYHEIFEILLKRNTNLDTFSFSGCGREFYKFLIFSNEKRLLERIKSIDIIYKPTQHSRILEAQLTVLIKELSPFLKSLKSLKFSIKEYFIHSLLELHNANIEKLILSDVNDPYYDFETLLGLFSNVKKVKIQSMIVSTKKLQERITNLEQNFPQIKFKIEYLY